MAASSACPHPKSYVTLLDEFACRLRLTPTYQLIQMEGMSHEPTFVYKVHLDGFEPATGRGKKKQDARQVICRTGLQGRSLKTVSSAPFQFDPFSTSHAWSRHLIDYLPSFM